MSDCIEVDGLRVGPHMWRNLKTENERLQAQVAELVVALQDAVEIIQADANTEENYASLCRMGNALSKSSSTAWLLRQKAEAIERAAVENRITRPHAPDFVLYSDLLFDAQELTEQADKLEQESCKHPSKSL